jgi:hypothetical protein
VKTGEVTQAVYEHPFVVRLCLAPHTTKVASLITEYRVVFDESN